MGCSNLRSLLLSPDLVGTICTVICTKWPQPISFTLYRIIHFLDGNKRVGAATALVFLTMNGVETTMANQVLVDMVLAVAKGKMDKPAIADFFRKHSRQ